MSYSKRMCLYVIDREQKGLVRIFEEFSDNIRNPYDNVFFLQNAVLDKITQNINNLKRDYVMPSNIWKGIKEDEKMIISSINLEEKFDHQQALCSELNIEYYDYDKFIEIIDDQLTEIGNKYNLNASDDYNKLYNYIYSIRLLLQSSDDALATLVNQHRFLKEHSQYGKYHDEYLTIYEERLYKVDVVNELLRIYSDAITVKKENVKTTKR